MTNKEFGILLERRTMRFAADLLLLLRSVGSDFETRIIKSQLIKSGTSIGANYREANHTRSKADFLNRIKICEAESCETLYWLELLFESDILKCDELKRLSEEAGELLAIFTSIGKRVKCKS